ncbi:sulfotransferase 1c4 [Plakobranchus ocellatus]|uniref:Sulfotransferase 1c4 n=1 Tax=Plakobranchus ocellatus TaxID=259542 RepID=A0AAV3Y418_9GAST|nr:sulfotransferase 1c4 [Plakobranchus ocellatus]
MDGEERYYVMNGDKKEYGTDADRVEVRPEDPYGFPFRWLCSGIIVNDVPVMKCPVKIESATQVRKMLALPMREDDILLTGYTKSGSHWMVEILHMLTARTTNYSERLKEHDQLEFINDLDSLEHDPSPRVLNTNCYMAHLPEEIAEKKVKIVHVIRNPKDVLVSMYFHMKQRAQEHFNFDNLLKGYVQDFYLYASHQFDFLRQIDQFLEANPGHPIIHIHFEDLKRDSFAVIQELAKFLELDASEEFLREVADAVRFDAMKKADQDRKLPPDTFQALCGKLQIYRKGAVLAQALRYTVSLSHSVPQVSKVSTLEDMDFCPPKAEETLKCSLDNTRKCAEIRSCV